MQSDQLIDAVHRREVCQHLPANLSRRFGCSSVIWVTQDDEWDTTRLDGHMFANAGLVRPRSNEWFDSPALMIAQRHFERVGIPDTIERDTAILIDECH